MGFMDHLLATLSPERAVKTAAARMAIQTLNSGYGNYGANLHKKSMRGWMWHGGDSKRDIEDNLRVLRERSRDAYATVTIRFTLSAAQKSVAMIPQGTRIRTGAGIYFATTEYAQIDIGETSVDVLAKAEEVGAESNDIPPGVIDTLVDAIPFVAGAENIDTSSGGADVESDDSLTRRIWLSPTTYSCAGPRDAYEFWAMSFRSDIENEEKKLARSVRKAA